MDTQAKEMTTRLSIAAPAREMMNIGIYQKYILAPASLIIEVSLDTGSINKETPLLGFPCLYFW